jgi:dipeptidyl aminopeptidase/acylaminoacyl peptidase
MRFQTRLLRCAEVRHSAIYCLSCDFRRLAAVASSAAQRGITPEDYFAFENISDAHIAPDGKQVVYTLTTVDKQKNRRDSSIWVVAVDGGSAPRRLTAEGVNSSSPRWSPDGTRLAFVSTRSTGAASAGRSAAGADLDSHLRRRRGAGAHPFEERRGRVSVVAGWQAAGGGEPRGPSDNVKASDRKSDVRHYTHISYKFNDTGWYDDKRTHLWVVDAAKGDAKQITSGDDWNDTDPQWSPDSTRIAFVSDRTGKEYDGGENKDVWVISADGGPLTKISDHDFDDTMPRWSPDGSQILFAGQTARRQFPKLYIASSAGGVKSTLAMRGYGPDSDGTGVGSGRARGAVRDGLSRDDAGVPRRPGDG